MKKILALMFVLAVAVPCVFAQRAAGGAPAQDAFPQQVGQDFPLPEEEPMVSLEKVLTKAVLEAQAAGDPVLKTKDAKWALGYIKTFHQNLKNWKKYEPGLLAQWEESLNTALDSVADEKDRAALEEYLNKPIKTGWGVEFVYNRDIGRAADDYWESMRTQKQDPKKPVVPAVTTQEAKDMIRYVQTFRKFVENSKEKLSHDMLVQWEESLDIAYKAIPNEQDQEKVWNYLCSPIRPGWDPKGTFRFDKDIW